MLIGEYGYSIDVKGRLNFPAKLREDLGDTFVLTKGFDDKCLLVYSMEEWKNFEDKVKSLPMSKARNLQRFFFASATEIEPDKQGRIVVPAVLREYALLDKDVMVIGASNHCEIWSKQRWDEICAELDTTSIVDIMDDIGF